MSISAAELLAEVVQIATILGSHPTPERVAAYIAAESGCPFTDVLEEALAATYDGGAT
jgi:hypothetical protein